MLLFSSPLAFCGLILLIGLHAVAVFCPGKIGKIVGYTNICLHILYIAPLLLAHFSLDEAVLCYMISVFFYTLFSVVARAVFVKKSRETAPCNEEVAPCEESSAPRQKEGRV